MTLNEDSEKEGRGKGRYILPLSTAAERLTKNGKKKGKKNEWEGEKEEKEGEKEE
jgi:hypothetical protein